MITAENKYFANLDILQNVNYPTYALLPTADKIYNVDVNSRKIDNPNITIVEKDHRSTTLYFSINRHVDYMDLAHTKCIIQYNIKNQTYYYPVPFYDVYTQMIEDKIIFPWNLDYAIAESPGEVSFNIRFFKTGTIQNNNTIEDIVTYNLNILPSSLKIEKSLTEHHLTSEDKEYLKPNEVQKIMQYVDTTMQTLSRKIYWTVLNDDYQDTSIDVSGKIQNQLLDVIT